MVNGQRIRQAIYGVEFDQRAGVMQMKDHLKDVPSKEVVRWLEKESRKWDYSELLYGVKNIEEIFGTSFTPKRLIELYFEESEAWFNTSDTELLKKFYEITGRNDISVDDIAELIDLNFVRKSIEFDVGVMGFIQFIHTNGGNTKPFIKRLVAVAENLNIQEVSEIVACEEYIDIDSSDAEELLKYVNWSAVKEWDDENQFVAFFKKFAPSLVPQMAQ